MKKEKIKQQRNEGTKWATARIVSLAPSKAEVRGISIALLCFFVPLLLNAATVLIPLQTCGISPAADRSITLTPLQALGSNSIPVMDKIQGTTDANGNWSPTLLQGVYKADVRPVNGAVGVTEFYFYVDPSNAVQNALANLLTGTNNTWPPNQYAYSASASDERYAPAGSAGNGNPNAVTNNQTGVIFTNLAIYGSATLNKAPVTANTTSIYSFQTDTNHIVAYEYNTIPGFGFFSVTNVYTWNDNFSYIDEADETLTGAYTNLQGHLTNTIADSIDFGVWVMMTNATSDLLSGNYQFYPNNGASPVGTWAQASMTASNLYTTYASTNLSVTNLTTSTYVSPTQIAPGQSLSEISTLSMNSPPGQGIDVFGQAMFNHWHLNDQGDGWSMFADESIELAWLSDNTFYIADASLFGPHWTGSGQIQDGLHQPGTNILGDLDLFCGAVGWQPTTLFIYNDFGNSKQVTPFKISAQNSGKYFWQLESVTNGGKATSAILLNNTNNDYPIVLTNCLILIPTNYDPSGWSPINGCSFLKGSNNWVFSIAVTGTNAAWRTAP